KGPRDDDNVNTANVLLANANGTSFTQHTLPENFEIEGDLTNIYIGDFNGDGRDDFLRQEKGPRDDDNVNTANVLLANANGTSFTKHVLSEEDFALKGFNLGGDSSKLHIGDFNGDGKANFFHQLNTDGTGQIGLLASGAALEAQEAQATFQAQFSTVGIGDASFIEVEDTRLDVGRILVTGGYLDGTGTLDAAADSKLEILNHSDLSLQVNDIDVSDTGGGLFFNFAPSDGTGANFPTVKTGRPEVLIQNTSNNGTVIQLDGNINNLSGTIRVDNAVGDTIVNGDLRANTIDIATGGSVIQGFIPGTRHLGGDPESLWFETAAASAEARQTVDLGSTGGNSAIVGNNVFIAGEFINVNGTIQAGRAEHSVIIDDRRAFQAAIDNFNQQFDSDNSQHLFDFNAADHGITTAGDDHQLGRPLGQPQRNARDQQDDHQLVRLQWNARDQQIEAQNLDVTGGYLELHGHIYSTGDGQLRALDGFSQIQIENNTTHDLKLNGLNNNDAAGKIKITDTARAGNSPAGFHVTEIERLGNTIRTTVNGELSSEVDGRNTTYSPQANQVYRFETSQTRRETERLRKVRTGTALNTFLEIEGNTRVENRAPTIDEALGVVTLLPFAGQVITANQDNAYEFTEIGRQNISFTETAKRSQGVTHAGTREELHFERIRDYIRDHRHSIDADNEISIEFIGYDEGIVNVQSDQSQVILDGILNNVGGSTTLEASAISATNEGYLVSDQVTLNADNDIDLSIQGSADGGTVEATSTNGDLNLTYLNSVVQQADLSARNGDIAFTADAGINDGTFVGNDITLTSNAGGITATVETVLGATTGLTATASGEINLTGAALLEPVNGDVIPLINQVTSSAGIFLNGEFIGTVFEGQASGEEEFQTTLTDFTAFSSEATIDDYYADIAAGKQADYIQYWEIRTAAGDTFDPATDTFTYTEDQRTNLQAQGLTQAEITALEQETAQWVQARHTEFDAPTVYDPNFTYEIPQDERTQLEQTLSQTNQTWQTQIDLLGGYQNAQAFFGAVDGTESSLINSERNISSDSLNQEQVFQIQDPLTGAITIVNRDDLFAILTEEQRDAVLQAEARGDI
ncbi:MAG: hypothetical protein AAFR24_03130, partial [Cyanobacteria bacterium J06627_3]